MSDIRIITTQNVHIDHKVANIGQRIAATFIDYMVLVAYLILAFLLISVLHLDVSMPVLIVIFSPFLFYHLAMELVFDGRSVGKMLVKTKVVRLDGKEVGVSDYFMRWLLRLLDITIMYGIVAIATILINGRGQRLGDLLAGTTVVSTEVTKSDHDIFTNIDAEYIPQFTGVALLDDDDILLIRDVMSFVQHAHSKHAIDVAYKAKHELCYKMGVDSEMNASAFFAQVIRDYTAYYSQTNRID